MTFFSSEGLRIPLYEAMKVLAKYDHRLWRKMHRSNWVFTGLTVDEDFKNAKSSGSMAVTLGGSNYTQIHLDVINRTAINKGIRRDNLLAAILVHEWKHTGRGGSHRKEFVPQKAAVDFARKTGDKNLIRFMELAMEQITPDGRWWSAVGMLTT